MSSKWNCRIDLTGCKFDYLTVIEYAGDRKWLCECECGGRKVIDGGELRRKPTVHRPNVRHCGCKTPELRATNTLPPGVAMRNKVLYRYKQDASNRGYSWELTDEEAIQLFSEDCFYCGEVPSNEERSPKYNDGFTYNGIDRKNNDKGYTPDDVVTCCKTCNYMKRAMGLDEFLSKIAQITRHMEVSN